MSYEENYKEYRNNVKKGILISTAAHLFIIILLIVIVKSGAPHFKEGINSSSSAILDLSNIELENYDAEEGGGGGGGGGIDASGGGGLKEEVLTGIPVPSKTAEDKNYAVQSIVIPDSASNTNLKKGPGTGSGEGTGNGPGTGSGSGSGKGSGLGNGNGDGTVNLTFAPRQILEVVPERKDNFKGLIKLSVRIGKEGLVKDHKILQNTTGNDDCLIKVLEAAYKSRWQAVRVQGTFVEYWTEKTYRFD